MFILSYIAPPVIISTQPSSSALNADIGCTLTLTCTSSGSPPDTFIWMKNGVPITNSCNITALNNTNTTAIFSTTYTISNLSINDMGVYSCTVRNPIGSDTREVINISICKCLCFIMLNGASILYCIRTYINDSKWYKFYYHGYSMIDPKVSSYILNLIV